MVINNLTLNEDFKNCCKLQSFGILASRRVASIFTRTATLEKVVFVSETIEDVCRTSFFDFYSKLSLYG